eukprot:TRINITY_DN13149_c0_g1_i1.p1 TRINITY_DN13149_c0_g1~~TRINITY_DN13149_c0_g1_i1.p1  ORF type:complete len:645 (-),score=148.50 TRINITY_DN13149_c0_g1_i1:41-1975(-)
MLPEEAVAFLSSPSAEERLGAARFIKNAVIGSRTKKDRYLSLGATSRLASLLTAEQDGNIIREAAAAVGSLSSGKDDRVRLVVEDGVVQALLSLLNHADPCVVLGCLRALRTVFRSTLAPRVLVFERRDVLLRLVALLDCDDTQPSDLARDLCDCSCVIIARVCEGSTEEQRKALGECGVIAPLHRMLFSDRERSQASSLDALQAFSYKSTELTHLSLAKDTVINKLFELVKDRDPTTRLMACMCVAALGRAGAVPPEMRRTLFSVLPIIIQLFKDKSRFVREEAPRVLADIMHENEDIQQAAAEIDAICELAAFVKCKPCSVRQAETALTALAEISSKHEMSRKKVVHARVASDIVQFIRNDSPSVRLAACRCLLSLSRSISNLRTCLLDEGVAFPLFELLEDPCIDVAVTACSALCNVLLDFTPMKRAIVARGGARKLVHLTTSPHRALRVQSLWALKNLLYLATMDVKEIILGELPVADLLRFFESGDFDVRLQAVAIARNLVHGNVEGMVNVEGGQGLLRACVNLVEESTPAPLLIEALYTVANALTGDSEHKDIICSFGLLPRLSHTLEATTSPAVRVAGLWCVVNFIWRDQFKFADRVSTLRSHRFSVVIERLLSDPNLEVADRARMCLDLLCVGGET